MSIHHCSQSYQVPYGLCASCSEDSREVCVHGLLRYDIYYGHYNERDGETEAGLPKGCGKDLVKFSQRLWFTLVVWDVGAQVADLDMVLLSQHHKLVQSPGCFFNHPCLTLLFSFLNWLYIMRKIKRILFFSVKIEVLGNFF